MDAVSRRGEGESFVDDAREVRVKTSCPEIVVFEVDAGGPVGAPPHFHKRHVDSFYVLEGELEFMVAGETVVAGAGTFVAIPIGVVHAFAKSGSSRTRYLNIHTPECGFTEYMRARDRDERVNPEDYDMFDAEA